jgi:hypothetical protein
MFASWPMTVSFPSRVLLLRIMQKLLDNPPIICLKVSIKRRCLGVAFHQPEQTGEAGHGDHL